MSKLRFDRQPPARDYDLALAVLTAVTPPGTCLSDSEIAEVCGVSRQAIRHVRLHGLAKIRVRLLGGELRHELRELVAS